MVLSCGERSTESSINKSKEQPLLGYRTTNILKIDGAEFKDLNRSGQLDSYEDWRLTEERSKDLVSKMSLEQKAGFMLISSTRLENDWSFQRGKSSGTIGSGFNEEDLVMEVNMFTRKPLPYPNMGAAGTTKAVTQYHERHFILRANPPARILAEWANNLQARGIGAGSHERPGANQIVCRYRPSGMGCRRDQERIYVHGGPEYRAKMAKSRGYIWGGCKIGCQYDSGNCVGVSGRKTKLYICCPDDQTFPRWWGN